MSNSNNKTRGVVLSTVPYNDQTSFVHIYTEEFGKISCRLTSGRRKQNSQQRMLYAPLAILDLVLSNQGQKEVFSIQEASSVLSPYILTMGDPGKTAQCLYMAELLDKTILEVEPNQKLWQFISQSIELLQLTESNSANFHLVFTTRLCYLLGFKVDNDSYREGMQFDISEGIYTNQPIYHPYYLTAESASWLHMLLNTNFKNLTELHLTREQRNTLLDMMLCFLRIHLPEAGQLRSVDVLKELFI